MLPPIFFLVQKEERKNSPKFIIFLQVNSIAMLDQLISKFKAAKVLVVGDVMIDAYLKGRVDRISPEAPVPILDVKERDYRLGGAANVAANLKALGAEPILCSVVGKDPKGKIFMDQLSKMGLTSEGIVQSNERITTIKYRIIGNQSQMIRVDEEDKHGLSEKENEQFLNALFNLIDRYQIDAIIFEDYDKGLLNPTNIAQIIQKAREKGILMTTDPKKKNFHAYGGVNLFKPNLKELSDALHLNQEQLTLEQLHDAAKQFAHQHEIDMVMVTLSDKGIALYHRLNDQFEWSPASAREVSDVSGAGDTVISVATLCMIVQLPPTQMIKVANLAGGIVCQFVGVVPVDPILLEEQIMELVEQNTKS